MGEITVQLQSSLCITTAVYNEGHGMLIIDKTYPISYTLLLLHLFLFYYLYYIHAHHHHHLLLSKHLYCLAHL